ncbi:MAG: BMP family ABC transporter substrate-binding protein [Desulfobulbaceae bacterium]|nr:BMP family ABC transporter substrate-binding protein [Desulfobulbaceae bacterium]
MKQLRILTVILAAFCLFSIGSRQAEATEAADFTFGLLMVGPANDHGWSQAHFEAAKIMEKDIPGTRMIYIDKVNPADRPGITIPMLVDDLVSKGAKLIIGNSDDMKDGMREASMMHPDIYFLHISGDDALTGKMDKNLSNLMGRMEYGKMMAGFVAAMTSKTGKIGYLGPLINAETRRLTASAFLGARYAWTEVLKKPLADLKFKVSWIGFWFNIPGVTSDPTLVTRQFFDSGYDVVLSGIDTTEALVVAGQQKKAGKAVWAVPYDFKEACTEAPDACLGVPYFNWVPGYKQFITDAKDGKWKQQFVWLGPDWKDINNVETSSIGFLEGKALGDSQKKALADFQKGLADGSINLFKGPLNFQDNSVFLKAGVEATDEQIWNLSQLLEGMEGASK